ncbi:MAG: response regulator transcription factor [Gammaproteobacteria bacterium]|nr:response regulator transcription factor [Gammaproteobacteria bacterium]
MNILITDDEALARERLRLLVESLGHTVSGEASHGEQALQMCETLSPDIILLDIRMPGMDGLETARHLMVLENPPAVIFITAFDQHALQAFEINALDYLLKPVRKERLEDALNKAGRLNRVQLAKVSDDQQQVRSHICTRSRNRLCLVPVHKIIFFMADQKYISVFSEDGEVLIEESLKSLEEEFQEKFIRIHRNALVAKDYILSMEKAVTGGQSLIMKATDKTLEVSRRHVPAVRKIIKGVGG